MASRDGSSANTWIYQTLDSPNTTASVLGYDVAINKVGGKLTGAWLAASEPLCQIQAKCVPKLLMVP